MITTSRHPALERSPTLPARQRAGSGSAQSRVSPVGSGDGARLTQNRRPSAAAAAAGSTVSCERRAAAPAARVDG